MRSSADVLIWLGLAVSLCGGCAAKTAAAPEAAAAAPKSSEAPVGTVAPVEVAQPPRCPEDPGLCFTVEPVDAGCGVSRGPPRHPPHHPAASRLCDVAGRGFHW